ncbi:MAG: 50S ribosomal subunit protein L9 [Candidatus Westeberhardia cardiocondylae]|nr:50S ribosomal subunit protein L9 [Candidatus Westeberhardia cardiocondylae]
MKVILIKKVLGLGDLGNIINVKPGYARNFLFPNGIAILASKKNIENIKSFKKNVNIVFETNYVEAKNKADRINKLEKIVIESRVSDHVTGKLFGSVNAKNICIAMSKFGINILQKEIFMPSGVFKFIGKYYINIKLHKKVSVNFCIIVIEKKD